MFDANKLQEALTVFIPVIINAVMMSAEASALQRELTEEEIDKVMDDVNLAVEAFIDNVGGSPDLDPDRLRHDLQVDIYDRIWCLMQEVTAELREKVEASKCAKKWT